jgi:hypothetical protein
MHTSVFSVFSCVFCSSEGRDIPLSTL